MTSFVLFVAKYFYIFSILKTRLFPDRPSLDATHCLIFKNQNDNIPIFQAFQVNIDGLMKSESLKFIPKSSLGCTFIQNQE
jgi:hypothetical protein